GSGRGVWRGWGGNVEGVAESEEESRGGKSSRVASGARDRGGEPEEGARQDLRGITGPSQAAAEDRPAAVPREERLDALGDLGRLELVGREHDAEPRLRDHRAEQEVLGQVIP